MRLASALLLVAAVTLPARAQDRSPGTAAVLAVHDSAGNIVFWKDPGHAASLSWWLAGLGHIYVGEEAMGYTLATANVITGSASLAGFIVWSGCGNGTYVCDGSEKKLALGGLGATFLLCWWSAGDAEKIAREHNARYHLGLRDVARDRLSLAPTLTRDAHDRPMYGLRVALR